MKSKITGRCEIQDPPWRTARRLLTLAFAAAPAFLPMGCSNPAADVCDMFCECEGCTQAEYDDCVGQGEGAVTEAEDAGCSSQYEDYLTCVAEEAECRDDEHFEYDGCVVEKETLSKCGNIGLNPCDDAAQKLCDCQLSCDSGPTGDQCTGQIECQSRCIAAATCSDIINQPSGSTYDNCLSGC
jgi:hypothetical protein